MYRWTWIKLIVLAVFGLATQVAAAQELPLGSALPMADASVTLADGSQATLSSLSGAQGTVLVFWSNQCPWVDKYEQRLQDLEQAYGERGVRFVLVNANDPAAFPQENQAASQERSRASGYGFPYVLDPAASLAKALGASRAPHVFVFDGARQLVYVGTIDDSPGDPANAQKNYLGDALEAVASGQAVSVTKTKAFGCTIKFPN